VQAFVGYCGGITRRSSALLVRRADGLRFTTDDSLTPSASVAVTVADTVTVTVTVTAYPQPRPSGTSRLTPQASQRRPSSVVTRLVSGRSATTLLARRRPPSELEQPNRIALPVECPVAQLCGMQRGAGWSYRHNCVPGTSVRGQNHVLSRRRLSLWSKKNNAFSGACLGTARVGR